MENGFYGGGIAGELFIGRKEYLNELNDSLNSKTNKHISLYGLPHIGKTSILKEWKRRNEEESNKYVFIFSTVSLSGYAIYIKLIARQLFQKISSIIECGDSLTSEEKISNYTENIRKNLDEVNKELKERNPSSEKISDILEILIEILTRLNLKTVLCLDEFEHVSCWSEDEYMMFASILMRRNLNLLCVTASRPHISYILSDYERQVSPFKPLLVNSFVDDDMECAISRISKNIENSSEKNKLDENYLQDVLSICGRNPYLLMLYNSFLKELSELQPKAIFRAKYDSFQHYFSDVVGFMLYEEERNKKSFSHIIKCYFGFTDDYRDIIDTYINIGYIETNVVDSVYSYKDDRYLLCLEDGRMAYYTTICPAFVNYLYMNKLDLIKDVRDILTGFVHSIRDITRFELSKVYSNNSQNWNKELLLRMKGKKRENGGIVYCYAYEYLDRSQTTRWTMKKISERQFPSSRANWINSNPTELIEIDHSSLKYVIDSFNRGVNNISPSLDPINLDNNGSILIHYWNIFSNYFGVLDYADSITCQEKLKAHISEIANARNQIQHFSRFDLTQSEVEDCRKRCIYLLQSIYSYWGDGIVASGKPF